jgi:hypothetical protein
MLGCKVFSLKWLDTDKKTCKNNVLTSFRQQHHGASLKLLTPDVSLKKINLRF